MFANEFCQQSHVVLQKRDMPVLESIKEPQVGPQLFSSGQQELSGLALGCCKDESKKQASGLSYPRNNDVRYLFLIASDVDYLSLLLLQAAQLGII